MNAATATLESLAHNRSGGMVAQWSRAARNESRSSTLGGNLATFVFFAIFIGLLGSGRERMLRDPGTYWHVVAGERMLTDGAIMRADEFSFSQQGQTWLAQQWLGECAMAVMHRLGGLDVVLLGGVTLLAFVFAWMAGRMTRAGISGPTTAVLAALAVGASSYHFLLRPHLASLAFMAALFVVLLEVDSGRAHPRRLIWLPVLLVVWTNTHGAALGGAATALIVLVVWLIVPHISIIRRYITDPAATVWTGATACLCAAALLVNPFGSSLPATWLSLMRSQVVPQMIVEHGRPDWTSPEGIMIAALAVAYLAMLSRAARSGLRVTWLMPLVWLMLSISRVRHGPLFSVVAVLAIADMARAVRESSHAAVQAGWLKFIWRRPSAARYESSCAGPVVAAALVLVCIALKIAGISAPLIGANWAHVSPDHWPVDAAPVARAAASRGRGRVFNDLGFGGYLIYSVPDVRIYIDDRCELYGDAGLLRYREVVSNPALFIGLAAYDDVDVAIIRRGTRLDRFLANVAGWKRLHADPVASVYQRAAL